MWSRHAEKRALHRVGINRRPGIGRINILENIGKNYALRLLTQNFKYD
jgi:hypothetical protein